MAIVIKLGGSLYGTPELSHWLRVLKQYSQQHAIIIVPGGGPFADQVRKAQIAHHFDDKTAHLMALLAMKQFGLLLCALEPACQPLHDNMSPTEALSVCLPDDHLLQEAALPHSWDITSDSIALWLANKIQAPQLVLIKRCEIHSQSIKQLCQNHTLDKGFADLFQRSQVMTRIIHYRQYAHFASFMTMDDHFLTLP